MHQPRSRAVAARLLAVLGCSVLSSAQVTVLFVDGDKDNRNQTWACVRGAALVRSRGCKS